MKLRIIKRVTKKLLREVVQRIVKAVDPDKIILFGSYAYGNPRKDSDLDIFVIMPSNLPRYKRTDPIYEALRGLIIPKDVIVYTPEEVDEWSEVPYAFSTSIIRKGKILYEKKKKQV